MNDLLVETCGQSWRGDDDEPHFCVLGRGHSSECTCHCARMFSETVELV